ncbi:hypothetical protein H4R33_002365 [Dimargaris cristalligena]|uniref:CAP domain-containing protein n=1 Tax=Dimargaris cristalligena TaxID=215637 RepID=A0A4P9ZQY2_9FUNG|nr:hypothetical protein H4R33_002365 [Dimargaris cristalligena]RKP35787.1 CAP domain-containing protein [Dimargaris cristalligena]|eukprot:RKP35787.1 CAP domain-containing protein [Dimargaris cristalligena]
MKVFRLVVVTALVLACASTAPGVGASASTGLNMAKMVDLINRERAKAHVPPVSYDPTLTRDANHHSIYQSRIGTMTHDDSRGDTQERLEQDGVPSVATGENVAWNQRDEREVMRDWMNSPGHRANILNPQFTRFGASRINGYWTQVFSKFSGDASGSGSGSGSGRRPSRFGLMTSYDQDDNDDSFGNWTHMVEFRRTPVINLDKREPRNPEYPCEHPLAEEELECCEWE